MAEVEKFDTHEKDGPPGRGVAFLPVEYLRQLIGLPHGSRLLHVFYDDLRQSFGLVIENPALPVTEPGAELPQLAAQVMFHIHKNTKEEGAKAILARYEVILEGAPQSYSVIAEDEYDDEPEVTHVEGEDGSLAPLGLVGMDLPNTDDGAHTE